MKLNKLLACLALVGLCCSPLAEAGQICVSIKNNLNQVTLPNGAEIDVQLYVGVNPNAIPLKFVINTNGENCYANPQIELALIQQAQIACKVANADATTILLHYNGSIAYTANNKQYKYTWTDGAMALNSAFSNATSCKDITNKDVTPLFNDNTGFAILHHAMDAINSHNPDY